MSIVKSYSLFDPKDKRENCKCLKCCGYGKEFWHAEQYYFGYDLETAIERKAQFPQTEIYSAPSVRFEQVGDYTKHS